MKFTCPHCGESVVDPALLSIAIKNLMTRYDVKSVRELGKWHVVRLLGEKGIGPASVAEIVDALLKIERAENVGGAS